MFTGLIEQVGRIGGWEKAGLSRRLAITHAPWDGGTSSLRPGDSVAVNGACLTAESVDRGRFVCSVLEETIARTSLADKPVGSRVNLERAMAADARFGGHMVQGHVDAVGTICDVRQTGADWIVRVTCSPAIMAGIVEKGSVALDGISLTVATLGSDGFEVHIIPHTWDNTALGDLAAGSGINIETDIIGKYVQRHLAAGKAGHVSMESLRTAGNWLS